MPEFRGEHLSVAKTFYQLNFYLRAVGLPFTVSDLYAAAYRERRGANYDDRWIQCLGDNPDVTESLSEPFTTHTIVETLMRTGHEPVVRALMREVRRHGIGFTQAYMAGSPRSR